MSATRALRIAMLAPPWNTVPPKASGGTQANMALLADELVRRGHHVEIFCAPGSHSTAVVRPVLKRPFPEFLGRSVFEADFVGRAFEAIEATDPPFDIVNDHSGYVALTMADRIRIPMTHTIHWHLAGHYAGFFAHHGPKAARLVVLSRGQLECAAGRCRRASEEALSRHDSIDTEPAELSATVIPNCLDLSERPFSVEKEGYLLWIGRLNEEKGPHRAIDAARLAGKRLVLAGKVLPGQESFFESQVKPRLDGEQITYIGEAERGRATELFLRAAGLLMPIEWCEPFGNVMIEALACGTPVVAYPEGAAPEIVLPGRNGFLADNVEEMATAIADLSALDPRECRASVEERYSVERHTTLYENLFYEVLGG